MSRLILAMRSVMRRRSTSSFFSPADAGPLLGQAEALAAQARQVVAELGQLDLELALVRPGPLGEDVEDELGPVDDLALDLVLEVALLGAVEGAVEDDQIGVGFPGGVGDLLHLALADEPAGIEARPDLEDLPGHLGPGRRREAGQLRHGLLGFVLFGPGRGDVDEDGVFHGLPGSYCNRFRTCCSRPGPSSGENQATPAILRNQVICRLAYCRVSVFVKAAASDRPISPLRSRRTWL
jgi:hypothetical protein